MTNFEAVLVRDINHRPWWILHTGNLQRPVAMIDDVNMARLVESVTKQASEATRDR